MYSESGGACILRRVDLLVRHFAETYSYTLEMHHNTGLFRTQVEPGGVKDFKNREGWVFRTIKARLAR